MMIKEPDILKILGETSRFRILKLLLSTGMEICACELVDSLRIAKYSLSRHLDALLRTGLIKSRKEGRWVYYSGCSNQDPFCDRICHAITETKGDSYNQDSERFKKRLAIRTNGKCILGVQGKKLMGKVKCC